MTEERARALHKTGSCGHRLDRYSFCKECNEYRFNIPEAWLVQSLNEQGGWTISRHRTQAAAEKRAKKERKNYPTSKVVVTHDPALKT